MRTLFILLTVISAWLPVSAQESAAAIMQRCADKIEKMPSATIDFAVNAAKPYTGILTMSQSKFILKTPALSIWFDGKTQWAYIADNKEVNISEPTPEELLESNPFNIIAQFNKHYTCRRLKDAPGAYIIQLTPKSKDSTISSAKITIDKTSDRPTALLLNFASGHSLAISISNIKTGKTMPASSFKFDKKSYPAAEIIDLR